MTATICPIFTRLQRDMRREFGEPPAGVIDLRAERVRREREASERRFRERRGYPIHDFDGPGSA